MPLCGLARALQLVQGRVVLSAAAPLEPPALWLRHDGPAAASARAAGAAPGAGLGAAVGGSRRRPGSGPGAGTFETPGGKPPTAAAAAGAGAGVEWPARPGGSGGRGALAFCVHANARLDTLYSSRLLGRTHAAGGGGEPLPAPQHNACGAVPCTVARLHAKGLGKAERGVGVENP